MRANDINISLIGQSCSLVWQHCVTWGDCCSHFSSRRGNHERKSWKKNRENISDESLSKFAYLLFGTTVFYSSTRQFLLLFSLFTFGSNSGHTWQVEFERNRPRPLGAREREADQEWWQFARIIMAQNRDFSTNRLFGLFDTNANDKWSFGQSGALYTVLLLAKPNQANFFWRRTLSSDWLCYHCYCYVLIQVYIWWP